MNESSCRVLNQSVDVSAEFGKLENQCFVATDVVAFDPASGKGALRWKRHSRKPRLAFDQIVVPLEEAKSWEFPPEYEQDPVLPFEIAFVTPRTIRIRLHARAAAGAEAPSLMLVREPGRSAAWQSRQEEGQVVWQGPQGSLTLVQNPWRLEFRDAAGRLLTDTRQMGDTKCLSNASSVPFSFIRRTDDLGRQFAASFRLAPDEKLFGCGESFTRLNKRGQKVVLWTCDAHGVQTPALYKPIPFFLSSRGYGMFVHASTPMTFDFGQAYDSTTTLHVGDDELDVFVFLGSPREILSEYTALTGRSPMPPVWSFGLWMSRITYKSEAETREVAAQLRAHRIPCDVIHLDTGWFETDWRCDYQFSPTRFADPAKMIRDLREQGFRISLWQLPYFTPTNPLYREAVAQGYVVRDAKGQAATEDAVLDFSNPAAVRWYQGLLAGLLKMGVGAIKVDFGESGPLAGHYASGRTGWHEHNLYPLRYNQAAADITREVTGENVIWARSAWAGSQRYPLHWGGDAENTDGGMAASLRGGLSFGLCGFSFWSHDIGGFVQKSPEALYRRWLPFGMLTSHSRCHGVPPKEPWPYGESFTDAFRAAAELKYRLMPYVIAQAKESAAHGWPLLRTLFFEFPEDPTSWLIEDEYFFGRDLLVAPLMEETTGRQVYLPPGHWIDYQLAVMPGLRLMSVAQGETIRAFAAGGGVLLATGRTAHMDLHGVFHRQLGQPLLDVLGVRIRPESARLSDAVEVVLSDGTRFACEGPHAEWIEPGDGVEVLARFRGGMLDGKPAAFTRTFGRGRVFYAAAQSCDGLNAWLAEKAADAAGIPWHANGHTEVGILPDGRGGHWLFNHGHDTAVVDGTTLPAGDAARRDGP